MLTFLQRSLYFRQYKFKACKLFNDIQTRVKWEEKLWRQFVVMSGGQDRVLALMAATAGWKILFWVRRHAQTAHECYGNKKKRKRKTYFFLFYFLYGSAWILKHCRLFKSWVQQPYTQKSLLNRIHIYTTGCFFFYQPLAFSTSLSCFNRAKLKKK